MFDDGVMAHTAADLKWFWNIREDVGILSKKCPFDQHFDVSLPLKHMDEYIKKVKGELSALAEVSHCFVFGQRNLYNRFSNSPASVPVALTLSASHFPHFRK